jgi:hypothetical protein
MAQISTYKQIINIFETIASYHYQLHEFIVGKNWEVKDDIKFPFLQVSPYTAQVLRNVNGVGFNTLEMTLKLRVLEQLNKEEINKTDAYSDTLQILTDVMSLVNTHPAFADKTIQIVNNVEFLAEEELTTLNAIGWSAIVRLRIINYTGACTVPIADLTAASLITTLPSTKPAPYTPLDPGDPVNTDPDTKP